MDVFKSFCERHDVAHVCTKDDVLISLADVAKMVGVKNPRERFFPLGEKQTMYHNNRTQSCITSSGLKRWLSTSRKPAALELAKELGIQVIDVLSSSLEASSLAFICTVFEGEDVRLQYPVEGYFVDLYFFQHKIAVECDENGNRTYTGDEERQDTIANKLGCKFVRYNPTFTQTIALSVREIMTVIHSNKHC